MRNFSLVKSVDAKKKMEEYVASALKQMQLEPKDQKSMEEAGLRGNTLMMLPALFRLVATLQKKKHKFAIVFRSFGKDHEKIRKEWNAFCEMRHPLFKSFLKSIGPLDGSKPGVPDRRLYRIHTLYRDVDGPVLALDTFTNGPDHAPWDDWAKQKPRPATDTRGGRDFLQNQLKAMTLEGTSELQRWFESNLREEKTVAIKDDWAWWTWHDEASECGKLMCVAEPSLMRQLFFDDNVDHGEPHIVDVRKSDGSTMPKEQVMQRVITKVNAVEALMDDNYFIQAVLRCHNLKLDIPSRKISLDDGVRKPLGFASFLMCRGCGTKEDEITERQESRCCD